MPPDAFARTGMAPVTITHSAGSYPVHIGRGLLDRAGTLIETRGAVFIVTSPSINARLGERVARSFGSSAQIVEIAEGESRKTLPGVERLLTILLERGARRDATIVALGGGMIGDTAGFAASILLRGVALVHVPTTLLAQVDSSLGGKVGVNHSAGKNLIGSFHQPIAVITDPSTLDSLPQRDFVSGLFEALKGGVVGDEELFDRIASSVPSILTRDPALLDEVIRRKIAVKAAIVSKDEREGGLRRLLNYGHTIGHALEAAAGYEHLTHGEAVGWGMIAANAVARRRGLLSAADAHRIEGAVRALEPAAIPPLKRADLLAAAERDKKNRKATRVMVLPRTIGRAAIVEDVAEDEIEYALDAILTA